MAWGSQEETLSAHVSAAGQGREVVSAPCKGSGAHLLIPISVGSFGIAHCTMQHLQDFAPHDLLQVFFSHPCGLVVILWYSSPVGVALHGGGCRDNLGFGKP